MEYSEISNRRISNQQIIDSEFLSAKDLIGFMGAMQAQDLLMVKWALGSRLQGSTEKSIENAYNKGEIIRTHLMRSTWHLVSPDDVYWLLELTAPRIKPLLNSSNAKLELTDSVIKKCYRILENELSNCTHLTRAELTQLFENENIKNNDNRLSHIMMSAELDGLVCSGPLRNNKLTYALLSDRVPNKRLLSKEESLCELANRYFSSHGPATLHDFVWWSGLSVTEARKALEMNKSALNSETKETVTYWFPNSRQTFKSAKNVHLLPAFDELLISYRDRTAIISDYHNKKAISDNGIFRPIIIVDNEVKGTWGRTTQKKFTVIEVNLFKDYDEEIRIKIESEVNRYASFIDRPVRLIMA